MMSRCFDALLVLSMVQQESDGAGARRHRWDGPSTHYMFACWRIPDFCAILWMAVALELVIPQSVDRYCDQLVHSRCLNVLTPQHVEVSAQGTGPCFRKEPCVCFHRPPTQEQQSSTIPSRLHDQASFEAADVQDMATSWSVLRAEMLGQVRNTTDALGMIPGPNP